MTNQIEGPSQHETISRMPKEYVKHRHPRYFWEPTPEQLSRDKCTNPL
jgi:hypothetical protein